jgi:hypothetical protein
MAFGQNLTYLKSQSRMPITVRESGGRRYKMAKVEDILRWKKTARMQVCEELA